MPKYTPAEERGQQVFSREGSDQEPLPKPTPVWRGCAMKPGTIVGRPAPPKETPQTEAEPDSEPPFSRRTHPADADSPCILTGPLPRCQEKMAHGDFFSSQNPCGGVPFSIPPNLVQEETGHERSPPLPRRSRPSCSTASWMSSAPAATRPPFARPTSIGPGATAPSTSCGTRRTWAPRKWWRFSRTWPDAPTCRRRKWKRGPPSRPGYPRRLLPSHRTAGQGVVHGRDQ